MAEPNGMHLEIRGSSGSSTSPLSPGFLPSLPTIDEHI